MKKISTLLLLCFLAFSRLSAQCNPDTQAPIVTTVGALNVNMVPPKILTLWGSDFVNTAQDNCTTYNMLQFAIRRAGSGGVGFPVDTNGVPIHSITFTCNDVGSQVTVEIWARDAAGNAGMSTSTTFIGDNSHNCFPPPVKNSCAITEQKQYLEEVEWYLASISGSPGTPPLHLSAPCVENLPYPIVAVSVTPEKINDPLNGVTTFDLVLINKHILGLEALSSPYKMLAADANNSRSITTFDIVELRKLILGIYTQLPNNHSWRFLPISFDFPNPANPFQTIIPRSDTINGLNFMYSHSFGAYKVGDVNGSAVANALNTETKDRTATILHAEDRILTPSGNPVRVPLYLRAPEALLGLQFALRFDSTILQISGVELGSRLGTGQNPAAEALFYALPEPGLLTFSWDAAAAPEIAAGEPVFYLSVRALQPTQLSRALQFETSRLQPEWYTAGGNVRDLLLEFDAAPAVDETVIYPAVPNPSSGPVAIPMQLATPAAVLVEVFDLSGRQVYGSEQQLPGGFQRLEIPAGALAGQRGILTYRVQAGTVAAQGKILRW